MAVLEILEFPDPRLRTKAKPVAQVTEATRSLIADMFETMHEASGIGVTQVVPFPWNERVPVVREYQDEYFERYALILDTFAAASEAEVFEEAVAVAASFACTIDTQECMLDLMFVGRETYCFTAGRGNLQAQQLLEVLAAVSPHAGGEFNALAASVLAGRAALSSAILVLLAWDEARRDLVKRLHATGLEVLALVVSDAPEGIIERAPWLTVLQPGKIQQGLAAVGA